MKKYVWPEDKYATDEREKLDDHSSSSYCAYRITDLQYHFSKKSEEKKTTVCRKYPIFIYAYEEYRRHQQKDIWDFKRDQWNDPGAERHRRVHRKKEEGDWGDQADDCDKWHNPWLCNLR